MSKALDAKGADVEPTTCIDHPVLRIPACECHEYRRRLITALQELWQRVDTRLQEVGTKRLLGLSTSRTKQRIGCLKELLKDISAVRKALTEKRTSIQSIQRKLEDWQSDQYAHGGFNIDPLYCCLNDHLAYLTDVGLSQYRAQTDPRRPRAR